jgi:GNAT superfamily N-acetyltransferase
LSALEKTLRPAAPTATASGVEIRVVEGARARRAFIRAGSVPYKGDPAFVPPLEFELGQRLDPRLNPALKDAPHRLFIAYRGGAAVGRISVIANPLHLARHRDDAAHFGFLEAVDDEETFAALLGSAEDWARARGMKKIAGPFSFSVNEECGLLVEGFAEPPYVMMPHGRPYYRTQVEARGYRKAMDMHALKWLPQHAIMPERRKAFVEKTLENPKVSLRNLDPKTFVSDIRICLDIFNDAWSENWGFVPLTEEQARHMASELRPIIAPYNVVIGSFDGEPVAFALALPNINEAIRDFGGKLLPFNWATLLWRLKAKGLSTARMPLMGVRRKYQRRPVGAAMAYKMIETINSANIERGVTSSELSWILESNEAMLAMLHDMGATIYKTYRIYEKAL